MRALVLIDFQNEWMDEKSEYYIGDVSHIISKTNKLIEYCRKEGYQIFFTRHIEDDDTEAFMEGSAGAEIIPTLNKEKHDKVITKNRISPFYKTDLEHYLRKAEFVVVCGLLTNLCVRSFIDDAYDRDMTITMITDCCASFEKEMHDFTIKDLKATREEVQFMTAEEFITQ